MRIFPIVFILFLASCSVEKNISKKQQTVDSTVVIEKDKQIAELTKEVSRLTSKVSELEYLGISFTQSKPLNLDSLKKVMVAANCPQSLIEWMANEINSYKSTVEQLTDGTIRITGNIESLTRSKSKLEEIISSKDSEITRLTNELQKEKTNVKTTTVEKEKIVERKSFNIWIIILIFIGGMVLGGFLMYRLYLIAEDKK